MTRTKYTLDVREAVITPTIAKFSVTVIETGNLLAVNTQE
jgi:hypothetical protein